MTTTAQLYQKKNISALSAAVAAGITLLALILGVALMTGVQSQTKLVDHNGVKAAVPPDWFVTKGLVTEKLVFQAGDPFDPSHIYAINQLPTAPGSPVTDLVGPRNLARGQSLDSYRVLDQTAVVFMGKQAYKVHFAYVNPLGQDQVPLVIEGVDYYFLGQPNSMVVTMEEETGLFEEAVPNFMTFLSTVSFTAGGAQ
jgi:hypothetical protein